MNDLPAQHELRGGNVAVEVVRVSDTVRRPATRRSSSVDALLEHLHVVGFGGAPRPLGYDDAGRQTPSFVEGYVGPDPSDLDVDRLNDVDQLVRRLHDATSTFVAPRVPTSLTCWARACGRCTSFSNTVTNAASSRGVVCGTRATALS